jgi:hypothetical protein
MSWRRVFPEKPTVAQLLIQFLVFYRTCWFITTFTTSWLTPSHLTSSAHLSCSHTYSSLNDIAIGTHRFTAHQIPGWHTKMRDKKLRHCQVTEPLTQHTNLQLAKTTSDEPQTSNFINPKLNYIYKIKHPNKKLSRRWQTLPSSSDAYIKLAYSKPEHNHSRKVTSVIIVTVQ